MDASNGIGDAAPMRNAVATLQDFNRFWLTAFGATDAAEAAAQRVAGLEPHQQIDLAAALGLVQGLLGGADALAIHIRTFRVGDLAMIAARQSILYAEQQGWGRGLEINEGEATTAFLRNFKPGREQGWIAELGGATAGSILLTDEGDGLGRLRLLYVEPWARGRGLGPALVGECIGFARQVGYHAVTLWTHSVLESARRIYAAEGFRLTESAIHHTFGEPVQGETWRLEFAPRDV